MRGQIIFILSFFTLSLYPKESNENVLHRLVSYSMYGEKEGQLRSSNIYGMAQDKEGLIWLSTDNGLSSFDGLKYKNYTTKDGLLSNQLHQIYYDKADRLWISTWDNGFQIWNGPKLDAEDLEELGIESPHAIRFKEDPNGTLWLGMEKDLLQIKVADDSIIIEKHYALGRSNYDIVFQDNFIWAVDLYKGLTRIDRETDSVKIFRASDGLGNDICYSLFVDDKDLWIGHFGGLTKYDGKNFVEYELAGHENGNRPYHIRRIDSVTLEMGMYGNGIVRWNHNNDNYQSVGQNHGIRYPYIYCHLEDFEGNHWYGTEGNGFYKVNSWDVYIENKFQQWESPHVTAFAFKGDTQYIAFKGWGVLRRDSKGNNQFYDINHTSIGYVTTLKPMGDSVWMGSTGALSVIKQDRAREYKDSRLSNPFNQHVQNITLYDNQPVVKVGKYIAHISNHTPTSIIAIGSGLSSVLFQWKDKMIYGHRRGISVYDPKNANFTPLNEIPEKPMLSYTQDFKGNYWIGSTDHLIFMDAQSGSTKSWNTFDLYNKSIFSALCAYKNKVYAILNNDIHVIDMQGYYENDTLIIDRLEIPYKLKKNGELKYSPRALMIRNNTLLAGTDRGLLHYDLSSSQRKAMAKASINELLLFSKPINPTNYNHQLDDKGRLKSINFPHNENHITLNFRAISNANTDKVNYKYRLIGFSDQWSNSTQDRSVTYEYLPPATYCFELLYAASDGKWQIEEPLRLHITIEAPFWKTLWFRSLVILIILSCITLVVWLYGRHLKNKAIRKASFARQLVLSREEERRKIAKDLHDDIGQNLVLAKNALILGKENAEGLIQEALEGIRQTSRNIHPAEVDHMGLTQSLEELFEKLNRSTDIVFTEDIDNLDTYFNNEEQLHIYRIVQEACSNIIKHAKATAVRITMEVEPFLKLSLQDNGIGFDLTKSSTGLGLTTMQERADILKAKIAFTSGPKGTLIEITFKNVET